MPRGLCRGRAWCSRWGGSPSRSTRLASSAGKEVIVTVHPGDSMPTIAGETARRGRHRPRPSPFGSTPSSARRPCTPGSYEIAQGSSFAHVKAVLGAAPNVEVVDVTPGLTLHEVALNVASAMGYVVRGDTRSSPPRPNDATSRPCRQGAARSRASSAPASTHRRRATTPAALARRMVERLREGGRRGGPDALDDAERAQRLPARSSPPRSSRRRATTRRTCPRWRG